MSQRHVSIDETVVQALSLIPPTVIAAAELQEYTGVPLVVTLIHLSSPGVQSVSVFESLVPT